MTRRREKRTVVFYDDVDDFHGAIADLLGEDVKIALWPAQPEEARQWAAKAADQLRNGDLTEEITEWVAEVMDALAAGKSSAHALGVTQRSPGRPGADPRRDAELALAVEQEIARGAPKSGKSGGAYYKVAERYGTTENVVEAAHRAYESGMLTVIDVRKNSP